MSFLPVWLLAAIVAGVSLGLTLPAPPLALAISVAVSFMLTALAFARHQAVRVLSSALGGMTLAAWALGSLDDGTARDPPLAAVARMPWPVELEGVLAQDAVPDGDSVRLRLSVERASGVSSAADGDVALSIGGLRARDTSPAWRAGRRVVTRGSVRRPALYLNEGVADDRLALARHGLILVGSVKSAALVDLVQRGSWLSETGADVRQFVRGAVSRRVGRIDSIAGAIATAILIGDRTGLDPALIDRLQAAGTYHVIAISGGNIAIFASTLILVAWILRVPTPAASLLAVMAVWLYAGLVGGSASVTRAAAMATIYLGLRARDLRARPICALATASAVMLVGVPLLATDAGFVLTVGATGAIVLLAGRLVALVPWPAIIRPAVAVVAASVATEAVLLPASALLFGRVTVAGPLLNLAAVPAMALVQEAGMAVCALDKWWPAAADLAGQLTVAGAWLLVRSADVMASVPALAIRVPAPAAWAVAWYAMAGALALSAPWLAWMPGRWRRRARIAGAMSVALAAGWIVAHPWTWRMPWGQSGLLRVTSIDVGQGDATLVTLPDATTLLVDTGGLGMDAAFDIGARVVAPAIWARRVGRLDGLLLTHGDPDHIGGAATIIDVFRPSSIWEGIVVPSHAPMEALRAQGRACGLLWQTLVEGADWERGGVRLHVWSPAPPDWERPRVRNDDSVVLELRYRDVSIVLPGDIGRDVERDLAARIPPSPLRVLKLAHHGSATSTSEAFLEALRPSIALVSCGRDNRFGHPASDVMARLAARHIPVLRTDSAGEIDLFTDGRTVTVHTPPDRNP